MCNVLIFIFHKLNDITTMTYKIVKQIIWPWLLTLTFDLDDLKNTNCFKICDLFEVTWRKNVTPYVKSETTYRMRPSTRNIFQPTRSVYDFCFKSYGSKDDFHGYWCVWPWPWHLKVIRFLSIHLVSLHDWCKFRSDMFINSGDIAHWNMQKLPILYNGDIRCHGNVCYIIRINAIVLRDTSDRSKQYVFQFWEESVDNWRC